MTDCPNCPDYARNLACTGCGAIVEVDHQCAAVYLPAEKVLRQQTANEAFEKSMDRANPNWRQDAANRMAKDVDDEILKELEDRISKEPCANWVDHQWEEQRHGYYRCTKCPWEKTYAEIIDGNGILGQRHEEDCPDPQETKGCHVTCPDPIVSTPKERDLLWRLVRIANGNGSLSIDRVESLLHTINAAIEALSEARRQLPEETDAASIIDVALRKLGVIPELRPNE